MLTRLVVLSSAFFTSATSAQHVVARTTPPQQHTTAVANLARLTVEFRDVSLESAIRTVADKAGVQVTYSNGLLPKKTVRMRVSNATAMEAFTQLLQGTGLTPRQDPSGLIVLARAAPRSVPGDGSISGKVTDAKTRESIAGATIVLDGATRAVQTATDGTFRIADVPAGSHTLRVKMLGYAPLIHTVPVTDGITAQVTIELTPSAKALDQVVVTGTIIATELKEVPSAMTVVTAKQLEERGITRIEQLFRGDIPGLFAQNLGVFTELDSVAMFSRGATRLPTSSYYGATSPIKTYVDGVELANASYLSQIDPKSIDRIEILTGPQASTIYGSNAINGVMQIFTKRGRTNRPQVNASLMSGLIENNYSTSKAPQHDYSLMANGTEGRWAYNAGGSWNFIGAWSPSRRTTRTSSFAGGRLQVGALSVDGSLRLGVTQNQGIGGGTSEGFRARVSTGVYDASRFFFRYPAVISALRGQTLGVTASYTPSAWWSNEFGFGRDLSDTETRQKRASYETLRDSLPSLSQATTMLTSLRYVSTMQLPLTRLAKMSLTAGADGWQSLSTTLAASSLALTGTLSTPSSLTRRPAHNSGAFVQAQLGLLEALFLTYGLRAEWNPNYGEEAQPNLAPRFGVAYTKEVGVMTAKLRASYGRSTRPPATSQKLSVAQTYAPYIAAWGPYDTQLANQELGPEFQQGGEGGLELYFGSRGSLVVTRYNQTVDALISSVSGADSILSLVQNPYGYASSTCISSPVLCGYVYYQQSQYLNIGSVRNQGWELQSSASLGPVTARGTYSWTKSRMIGITPKYRARFDIGLYPSLQPGVPVGLMPEHTWAFAVTYARQATSLSLNLNGIGFRYIYRDEFDNSFGNYRLQAIAPRMSLPRGYRSVGPGYTMADVNASQRLTSQLDAVLQVQNLTDSYHNDVSTVYGTIGRQTKIGGRIRF